MAKKIQGLDGSNPNMTIGVAGKPDIVPLRTMLEAAGISSLDDVSQTNNAISSRDDGIILMVEITYSNTWSYSLNSIQYTYKVTQVLDTKFKVLQTLNFQNFENRTIWNRHGIRLIFLQVGELGAFDFQVMLLSFVSGLGLVTVSTAIVDVVFLRILPQHETYQEYKYEITEETNHPHSYKKLPLETKST